ncbi:hypothetical protein GEMRC1_006800 [Eukaryota sp. GEM-RC1]
MERLPSSLPPGTVSSTAMILIAKHKHYGALRHALVAIHSAYRSGTNPQLLAEAICYLSSIHIPPSGTAIHFDLLSTSIALVSPGVNELPLMDVNGRCVFERVSLPHVIEIFTALSAEQSVIFVSKNPSLLSTFIEFFLSIYYPFDFLHSICEVLPLTSVMTLHNPIPYLFGTVFEPDPECVKTGALVVMIESDILKEKKGKDLEVVDMTIRNRTYVIPDKIYSKLVRMLKSCDCDSVYWSKRHNFRNMPKFDLYNDRNSVLPPSVSRRPINQFDCIDFDLFDNVAVGDFQSELIDWSNLFECRRELSRFNITKIRLAFLRVFVTLFQHYHRYLIIPKRLFHAEQFCTNFPENSHDWIKNVLDSAGFTHFLQTRLNPGPDDFEVLFFEDQILAKINRSNWTISKKPTPFLSDTSLYIHKVYFLPSSDYSFHPSMTSLRQSIGEPRCVPSLLNYFDVQIATTMNFIPRLTVTVMVSSTKENGVPLLSWSKNQTLDFIVENLENLNRSKTVEVIVPIQHILCCKVLKIRMIRLRETTIYLQSIFRMLPVRSHFLDQRRACISLQTNFRMLKCRKYYKNLCQSTLTIQKNFRMYQCRSRYNLLRTSSIKIQSVIRRRITQNSFNVLLKDHSCRTAFDVLNLWSFAHTPLINRTQFLLFASNYVDQPLFHLSLWRYELYKMALTVGNGDLLKSLLWWSSNNASSPEKRGNNIVKTKRRI